MNVPGDILMLAFSLPLMASLKLPARKKMIPIFLFSLGALLVVAAILRKLYCTVPALISQDFLKWYFREASISVYITNIPPSWPLVRNAYGSVFGFTKSDSHISPVGGVSIGGTVDTRKFDVSRSRYPHGQDFKKGTFEALESQEHINKIASSNATHEDDIPLEILRETTVTVARVPTDEADVEQGGVQHARPWQ